MKIPKKYSNKLSKKDKKRQLRSIRKARRSYRKGVYVDRPKLKSYHSKKSSWVTKFEKKYGEIKRFKRLLKTIPFPFKKIYPDEKYLNKKNNPPDVKIIFYEDGPDLKNISCYSNEQDRWRKSKIELPSKNELKIILDGKFTTERGRINCSLRENNGNWRWLGIQFVISDL